MLEISILDDWEMLGIGQKNAGIGGPLTCGHPAQDIRNNNAWIQN